jgi:type I restriction enzyme S subunit
MSPASETLDEMCELIIDCPHFTPEWTTSGYLVIRNQNIRDGRLDLSERSYTHLEDFERRIRRAKPRAGDIIFTREAPMGEVCLVPDGLECCVGQRQVLLRPAHNVDHRYLFYALRSPAVRHQILWNEGTGSTVSNVRIPILKAIKIPRLGEAEASIGEVLDNIDQKIELNRRTNETLEAMAQAIFRDWFVDFGPVRRKLEGTTDPVAIMGGLMPDPVRAAELAGLFPGGFGEDELPVGWSASTIGDAFNLTMGQSPPGETYNDTGDGLPFFQGRTDFGFRFPERRKFCSQPTRIANPDDTLISVRAPVGDLNMAWEECCIGRGVAAARHKAGGKTYTYYAMRHLQPELEQFESEGTVFGAINKKQFEQLPIVGPDPRLVDAFEVVAGALDDRLRIAVTENRTLAETRDYLLPRLMSGEVRVGELEAEVA